MDCHRLSVSAQPLQRRLPRRPLPRISLWIARRSSEAKRTATPASGRCDARGSWRRRGRPFCCTHRCRRRSRDPRRSSARSWAGQAEPGRPRPRPRRRRPLPSIRALARPRSRPRRTAERAHPMGAFRPGRRFRPHRLWIFHHPTIVASLHRSERDPWKSPRSWTRWPHCRRASASMRINSRAW